MKLQDFLGQSEQLTFQETAEDRDLTSQIQSRLIDLKLLNPPVDGLFGPLTTTALELFQKLFSCQEQDAIGADTAQKLLQAQDLPSPADLPLPGVELIKQFEGFSPKAYPDPGSGGEPITIGYGCTVKPDGSGWKLGDTVTEVEATQLLYWQLEDMYLPALEKIPAWKELNINQQGALLSFGYNLGANFYGKNGFASITRVLQNKQWDQIEATFVEYRNPGSSVEEGLKRRREAEAQLFLTPVSQ